MQAALLIPELGHLAMILALCLALVQSTLPMVGAWRGDRLWMSLAVPAARGQFCMLLFAFACLTWAFLNDDFSVALCRLQLQHRTAAGITNSHRRHLGQPMRVRLLFWALHSQRLGAWP
jgi:hypothetical protein